MNKLETKEFLYTIARYYPIVQNIVKKARKIPVFKVIVLSYIIMNNNIMTGELFACKRSSRKYVERYLSLMQNQYEAFAYHLEFIIATLDILETNNNLSIENGLISNINCLSQGSYADKLINSLKKYPENQLMKEVLYYV